MCPSVRILVSIVNILPAFLIRIKPSAEVSCIIPLSGDSITLHTTCTEAGDAQVDWEVEPFPAVDIFTVEVECKSVDSGVTTVKTTLLGRVFDYVQGPRVVELQEEEAECTFSGWYEDGDFFNRHDISPASVTCAWL